MADEDKESKTEEATEKKVRDTVEKGNLPFSRETPLFVSFLAFLLFTTFFATSTISEFTGFLTVFLERPEEWSLGSDVDVVSLFQSVIYQIAKGLVAFMVLMVAAGIVGSVMQNPPAFVADRIAPKLERISPMSGWSRLFGVKGFAEFFKAVGKLFLTVAFLVFTLRGVHAVLLGGMMMDPASFGMVIRELAIQILVTITLVMAAIAGLDLFWTRFQWKRDIRMTKQEIKDELKQSDGDPVVKARMRSLARDRNRQRMMAAVPKATLIIANPTHFSIALRYDREQDAAPIVVAKGQDLIALRIREIAEENGVTIFENVALARAMYKQVSVDSIIPPQFYQAVAELIRVVYAKSTPAMPNTGRP